MVANEVEPRRRHEGSKFFDQFEGLEDHVGGCVAPAALEAIQEAAVGQKRQALGGQRGRHSARDVPQAHAAMSGDADGGMDAEAGNRGTARARRHREIFQIDRVVHLGDAPAGARAGGYTPRDGSAVEFGEQRLAVLKGIGFFRADLRPQAAALEKSGDTAANAFGHPGYFGVAGRG